MRQRVVLYHYARLAFAAIIIGIICAILADSLKHLTETYEEKVLEKIAGSSTLLYLIFPSIGITIIYFLRKYAFKNRENKGIKEVYKTIDARRNELPLFKVPSHYFNGFLTVVFGGSTGIEVSTVVATAAVGAAAHKKKAIATGLKKELICAGVAAGVTVLFANPLAGWLFAVEVIAKKLTRSVFISCTASALVSWLYVYFMGSHSMFSFSVSDWHASALPYIGILSVLSALLAVYFTRIVIFIKHFFGGINNNFIRVNLGAITVGVLIFIFPYLYGDSYKGLAELVGQAGATPFTLSFGITLLLLVMLKPVAAALTLGAGGDGGVFAPSIVAGALLGVLVAITCNYYFHTHLIVVNFALIGVAATLSAAIHAPFTALFLACNLVPGGYNIFIPVMLASFAAKLLAKKLCSYTVYSFAKPEPVKLPLIK